MSPWPGRASGREARQATKATPTMEMAAEVMAAPPTMIGRRSTGPAAARPVGGRVGGVQVAAQDGAQERVLGLGPGGRGRFRGVDAGSG